MSIATLKLDESHDIEFEVSITGADGAPSIKLVVETSEYSIAFPCESIAGGVVCKIPELKNIISSGTYSTRLEVVINNKVYVPMSDSITFEPIVEIYSAPKSIKTIKTESIASQKTKNLEELPVQEPVVKEEVVAAVKKVVTKAPPPKGTAVAKLIAKRLKVECKSEDPVEIINEAIYNANPRDIMIASGLFEMADREGILYDKKALEELW